MNRGAVLFLVVASALCAVPILRGVAPLQIAGVAAVVALTGGIGWLIQSGRLPASLATPLYWSGLGCNVLAALALHATYAGWTLLLLVNGVVFLTQLRAGSRADGTAFLAFTLFLPRSLAGPVVGYRSFARRLQAGLRGRWSAAAAETGATYLAVGLAKLLLLGGEFERYIAPVFAAADAGATVGGTDAWVATIANYLQLYFELSGACDIACGVLLLAGVRVPPSFHAPLRATSIAGFWRRYHRTLVAFLRVYLYRPLRLGGRVPPLVAGTLAFLVAGLWLAPSALGLVWGLLQSAALLVDREARRRIAAPRGAALRSAGWFATHLFMAVTALFLRLSSLAGAGSLLQGLLGQAGFALPTASLNFFSPERQKQLVFTGAPLIANHTIGLIVTLLLLAIAFVAALAGPSLDVASRPWRRAYFIVVIYFVLGLALQITTISTMFPGARL